MTEKIEQLFPSCGKIGWCGWKTGPQKKQCFFAGRCAWKNKKPSLDVNVTKGAKPSKEE
jgi:hypothetical protein